MKIYRFDSDVGKSIEHYNSSRFVISKTAHLFDEGVIRCAYLNRGGVNLMNGFPFGLVRPFSGNRESGMGLGRKKG